MKENEIKELETKLYILKHTKICEVCKKEFVAKRTDGKYCSNTCNQKAYKSRRTLERKAKDREISRLCMRKLRESRKLG